MPSSNICPIFINEGNMKNISENRNNLDFSINTSGFGIL